MGTTVSNPVATTAKTKVMIVEDESIIALDIKNSLTRLGYAVTGVAASGDVALTKIREERPHLVLMDIHLKGDMNGIEVSRIIKSDFQLPVIYLTANADNSTFQSAQGTNPHAYLLKPFDEKALGIAIEVALNQHQKTQAVKASEYWYANAFQCLNEAVVATDSTGNVVYMNVFSEEIIGVKLAQVIDQPITNILRTQRKIQQVDRLSLRKADSIAFILKRVLSGSTAISFRPGTQLITHALSFIPIEGSATSIRDVSGHVTGSLFVFRPTNHTPNHIPDHAPSHPLDEREPEAKKVELDAQNNRSLQRKNPEQSFAKEDINLIKMFTLGFINNESVLLSTKNLVASSAKGIFTLSSRKKETLIEVKDIGGKQTAVVDQRSSYWEIIRHVLVENSFFPISQRTNGTFRFQYRTIPEDCQIFHTSPMELWETWYGKACPDLFNEGAIRIKLSRESIIVLRRGSWYRIQNLVLREKALHIKTIAGEMVVSLEDLLIWGAKT